MKPSGLGAPQTQRLRLGPHRTNEPSHRLATGALEPPLATALNMGDNEFAPVALSFAVPRVSSSFRLFRPEISGP